MNLCFYYTFYIDPAQREELPRIILWEMYGSQKPSMLVRALLKDAAEKSALIETHLSDWL